MSFLGREGSPLAQRPVNKTATQPFAGKSAPRADRSLSASPLPTVELSSAVQELVRENETLIGETIVLRGSYKAMVEKCTVYQTERVELKNEINSLRNQLGLAHDAVTDKDGTVINYRSECDRLQLIVKRQAEDIAEMKVTVEKASKAATGPTTRTTTVDSTGDAVTVMKEEIISVTRKANNALAELKKLSEGVLATPTGRCADAAKQCDWTAMLTKVESALTNMRQSRDACKASGTVVAMAALPVRDLSVDSMDIALALLRECIKARSTK